MNNTARIFLTCAVGAFIGSLVSLQMWQGFWFIGALVGGLVAYLGFNIREVISAIPVAYHRTIAWLPNHEYWSEVRSSFYGGFNLGVDVATSILFFALIIGSNSIFHNFQLREGLKSFVLAIVPSLLFCLLFGVCCGLLEALNCTDRTNAPNVFKLYFWLVPRGLFKTLKFLIKVMGWLIVKSPIIFSGLFEITILCIKGLVKFTVTLFRLIHSELRLLCAVYAAIGATIGYFTGNALAGAIAGGLLGVVNYEIVTIRVLKLAGAKSMFR